MFYIVTYATHSERYFELLKKSCPDLIVLGMGEKWNGFYGKIKAVVDFCRSKQPEDIVCYVDGFDSVVLVSPEEILEQYKSFQAPLVISKATTSDDLAGTYIQAKLFSKCKNVGLNLGLFVGTVKSMLDFWEQMQEGEDDQTYATRKCNKIDYVVIDDEYKLFYNYSSVEKLDVKKGALFVNGQKTCVISSPGNRDINSVLTRLNYKNLPLIEINFKYRLSTYAKHFIHEMVVLALIVGAFVYFKNAAFSTFLSSVLVVTLLQYEVGVKHLDIPVAQKLGYMTLHFAQASAALYVLYVGFQVEYKLKK
jgi:hypothetical protein